MKVTKANISKALIASNISKSVVSRGRVCSGMTEGFSYIFDNEDAIRVGYEKRSSSYQDYDIWLPRWEMQMKSISDALTNAGFVVEVNSTSVDIRK